MSNNFPINIEIVDEKKKTVMWKGIALGATIEDNRQKIKYYVNSESNYSWLLDYLKKFNGTGANI